MKKGLVSLIVPMYNVSAFLTPFIESVKRQTYSDWELLLVDDDSTDDSLSVALDFARTDQRIKVVRRKGCKGACARRNQGYDMADGEFICFFDSDDLLPSHTLEERVDAMTCNPEADFAVSPAISFDSTPFDIDRLALGLPIFDDDLRMFLCRFRLPFGVWTNIYRATYLQRSGLRWDESLGSMQDSDFNIRALAGGAKYVYHTGTGPGYYWRTGGNPQSITKKITSARGMDSQFYFYSRLKDRFYGTEYEGAVKRFGQTLMRRAALLQVGEVPDCMSSVPGQRRFRLLRGLYSSAVCRRLSVGVNLLLFPLSVGKEYLFHLRNRRVCCKYIRQCRARKSGGRLPQHDEND